jgi:hypothetical protein
VQSSIQINKPQNQWSKIMLSNLINDALSNQIAMLMQENKELDHAGDHGREHSLDLITDLFLEVGGAIMALKMEKRQLISSNTVLDAQVTQLKLKHISELDSFLDTHQEKINLVATRIEALIGEIELFKQSMGTHFTVSAPGISLLTTLQKNISECSYQSLRTYPEYSDFRENKVIPQEQLAHFPPSEALSLINREPILKEKTQRLTEEYRILENEISPLKEANEMLINTQKMMVDFHQKHLEKIRRESIDGPLNNLLELVQKAKNGMPWETLVTFNAWSIHYDCLTPNDVQYYKNMYDDEARKKVTEFQYKMESIISNVEIFVNLQKASKVGVK